MTTLRILATHPARRWVAALTLLAAGYATLAVPLLTRGAWLGTPEQASAHLSTWTVAAMAVSALCVQLRLSTIPRPAAAPRARRTRRARPTAGALEDGLARKRPAAPTEDMPSPGREVPPAQLDRTQRLPIYLVGRATVHTR